MGCKLQFGGILDVRGISGIQKAMKEPVHRFLIGGKDIQYPIL